MPNIPLASLGLNLPNITFQHGIAQVTRPITDHPPIVQNTLWGAIATINILNPGSPLAPPTQVNGVTALPANGKVQMEAMAQYIFQMFQQGVGLLALQEVPPPGTPNFQYLYAELNRLAAGSNLIDVQSLASHWLKTGTHAFGTTILTNPNQFKLTGGAMTDLNNRAGVYNVTALPSGQIIPIANIHGDFKTQLDTAAYANQFDGLCLGDLNISQTSMRTNPNPQALQSIETPTLVIDGLIHRANTVDFIQDTYSKKFNPTFTPDTARIAPIQHTPQPVIHHGPTPVPPPPFKPVVAAIDILATQATAYLEQVKRYLPPKFLDQSPIGIVGVGIEMPQPGKTDARITFRNKEIYDFIAGGFQHEEQQVGDVVNTTNSSHVDHSVAPVIDVPPFQPVVIKVPAKQAASFLDRAKAEANLPPDLIQNGRITGVELKTARKSDIAEITIKNRVVHQAILPFYQQWINEQEAILAQQVQKTTHHTTVTPIQGEKAKKDNVPPIIEKSTVDSQKKDATKIQLFNNEKRKTQADFIQKLNEFSATVKSLAASDPVSAQKGAELYNTLMKAQAAFFQALTPESNEIAIKAQITDFRNLCKNHFADADKVMGHGWLYRATEVLIKAVVGLFAAIGMTLGVVIGQGLANADHRQKFSDTFFALNKTEGTKALEATQQQILGDDKDQGLLDDEAFTPKI